LILAAVAPSAMADMAGPWPWSRKAPNPWGTPGPPPPGWFERQAQQFPNGDGSSAAVHTQDPESTPTTLTLEPPKHTGPFRSCGSGAGIGFVGIGLAWSLMWVGNRYVGRIVPRNDQ